MTRIFLVFAACLLMAGTSHGQSVLVDRPANLTPNNVNSILSSEGNRFGNFQSLNPTDYFFLDADTTLHSIDVFGVGDDGRDRFGSGTARPGFSLHIFADNNGQPDGLPFVFGGSFGSGGVVHFHALQEGPGGYDFLPGQPTSIRIDFTMANGGSEIVLPAGGYWLSVVNHVEDVSATEPGHWRWLQSNTPRDKEPEWSRWLYNFGSNNGEWFSISEAINNSLVFETQYAGGTMAWTLLGTQVVTLEPESFFVTRGDYVSGGISELAASDDEDLTLSRSNFDIQSRTEFVVKTTSPVLNPESIEFSLEGSVFARSEVRQTIEFFDYTLSSWEELDDSVSTRFSDTVVSVNPTGDLSRFVNQGDGCLQARIRYKSTSQRQAFSSNTDQILWTIE
ncbi:MAG: hypothetical protein AAF456_13655 [Planctomycetota bacterium]